MLPRVKIDNLPNTVKIIFFLLLFVLIVAVVFGGLVLVTEFLMNLETSFKS